MQPLPQPPPQPTPHPAPHVTSVCPPFITSNSSSFKTIALINSKDLPILFHFRILPTRIAFRIPRLYDSPVCDLLSTLNLGLKVGTSMIDISVNVNSDFKYPMNTVYKGDKILFRCKGCNAIPYGREYIISDYILCVH